MIKLQKLNRAWILALAGALVWSGAAGAPSAADTAAPREAAAATRPTDPIAHDPTMVKQGDWYYVVITGDAGRPNTYLPMKRSKDLVNWTELDPVFTSLPSWVLPTLGVPAAQAPKDLWAPDLSFWGGEWRLYYSVSQFGRNNSVIGLATTKSLDPASKDFGWVDRGLVLQSKPTPGDPNEFNAIDPDLSVDAQGRQWLSFGSFWTGIKLRRVNNATGLLSTSNTTLHNLVNRQAPPNAVEGPSIIRHGRYYYLFVAFDFCCRSVNSDYRVMVGRSTRITGPYVDRAGRSLLQGGGTEVLRGYNEFIGTGHPDVYSAGGVDYFVNHYYDATDNGAPRLNVRTLSWRGGWPEVSDPLNPSRSIGHGEAYVTISPRGGNTVVENNRCGFEGANIGLWTNLGNACQQWQISDQGNGSRILNRYSNKVAEVAGCNNVDGGNVAQWGWLGFLPAGNDCQRWNFAPARDGYTSISSVLPGARVWTAAGGTTTAGTNIEIRTATGATSQQFRFSPVGRVLLAHPTNGQRTLGVVSCRAATGQGRQVEHQARSTRACQEWRFRHVAGTAARYTVTNTASGLQLATRRTGSRQLRVVRPTSRNRDLRTWTLIPTSDGTWTLSGSRRTQTIKLLLP
ncbi:MAG TPA: family 43 glycosylhydrolase [Propionibacteriaceae bacterium]|nr:family 43 glycosylhydrolase [Propionibacteriaceae bacterium]